jgi:NADH-quinone oxidoreductase subunit C
LPSFFISSFSLLVVLPSSSPVPVLANFFSNSSGLRLKGFVDELLIDFSQYAGEIHSPADFAGLVQLISFDAPFRIFLFFPVEEKVGFSSFQPFFPASVWPEREIFEMFGIPIQTSQEAFNLDLRRLLTDYGFNGFPLRKSFPPTGFSELRYDASVNRVVEEPLILEQLAVSRKDWFSWAPTVQSKFLFGLFLVYDFDLIEIS